MNNNNKTIDYVISLIFKTDRLIRRRLKKEKRRLDPFSVLRLEALRYIAERKNPSMREVADYFLHYPTFSYFID